MEVSIDAALGQFVTQLDAGGRSEHTKSQYRRHVGLLSNWLADEGYRGGLGGVDHQLIARFLSSPAACVRPDGVAKRQTSINALRTSVRCFFGYAHAAGLIPTNPARLVRRARCSSGPPRSLSQGEEERLLAVLGDDRDGVMIRLLLSTGIRVGSLAALDVADFDADRGELRLRSMKGGREGVAYVPAEMVEVLRTYVADSGPGPLFRGRGGGRLTTRHVARRLRAWCERAGIGRLGPHTLRHTLAKRLLERTGRIEIVQAALGHRSIASTLIYARADSVAVRAAMEE